MAGSAERRDIPWEAPLDLAHGLRDDPDPPSILPGALAMDAEALALAAGLQRAWADHRADVEEAVAAAARLRTAFARPGDPTAEPMPAYAAPIPAKAPAR
jgi:hypothetical protein